MLTIKKTIDNDKNCFYLEFNFFIERKKVNFYLNENAIFFILENKKEYKTNSFTLLGILKFLANNFKNKENVVLRFLAIAILEYCKEFKLKGIYLLKNLKIESYKIDILKRKNVSNNEKEYILTTFFNETLNKN